MEETTSKTIINYALLDLVEYYIQRVEPFSIIIDNHNNWNLQLPDRLKSLPRFLLNLENSDLEDSYIDKENNIILTAGIDDIVYTKKLLPEDIHSVGPLKNPTLLEKSFVDQPPLKPQNLAIKQSMPDDAQLAHSMACMQAHNPNLFKD